MKMEEITDFNNPAEVDIIIEKMINTWNDKIASKYARKLNKIEAQTKRQKT